MYQSPSCLVQWFIIVVRALKGQSVGSQNGNISKIIAIKFISKYFYLARVESGSGRKCTSLPSLDSVFVIPEVSVSASGVETIALSVLGQDSSNLEEEDWSGSVVPFSLVGISCIFI